MDQPLHDFTPYSVGHASSHRMVSIGAVALFHVVAIYLLASGLAMGLLEKIPTVLKADVIPPKQEQVKPPPPPPPDLQKPPPPFVPPPDINIQTEAAPTNTITVQSKVSTPPPPPQPPAAPKPAGISAPVSLKAAHNCSDRFYPPIAQRLSQEGITRVRITVSAEGQVTDAKVVGPSGHDSLDDAAVRCVMSGSWGGYHPAMQNGAPIAAQTDVNIVWKLSGQ